jgi:hypothetical protein
MHQYYIGLTENWKPGGQLYPKRKNSQGKVYLGCSFFLKYFKTYVQYMLWVTTKAVNRGDKRTRRVGDRVFVKFERSRRYRDRYRDRYRCQEKKSRRGRARDPVFRDPPTPRTSPRSLFAARDSPTPIMHNAVICK